MQCKSLSPFHPLRLFKAHPYLMSFFPAFKGLSDDELRKSPGLKAHATSVMYAIKSYVGTVDDAETLAGLVTKMATSHVPRGITVQDLEVRACTDFGVLCDVSSTKDFISTIRSHSCRFLSAPSGWTEQSQTIELSRVTHTVP